MFKSEGYRQIIIVMLDTLYFILTTRYFILSTQYYSNNAILHHLVLL